MQGLHEFLLKFLEASDSSKSCDSEHSKLPMQGPKGAPHQETPRNQTIRLMDKILHYPL